MLVPADGAQRQGQRRHRDLHIVSLSEIANYSYTIFYFFKLN